MSGVINPRVERYFEQLGRGQGPLADPGDQPAAKLLTGAPSVQLIRWSQSNFPATLPGGVVDSHPLMAPIAIPVPEDIAAMEALVAGRWAQGNFDDIDAENLGTH